MKENVLDVLIYLFENYMFDEGEYEPDQETLALELRQAGFEHGMIDRAFDWLENLAQLCEQNAAELGANPGANPGTNPGANQRALRHYTPCEAERLGIEAQGLLLNLEQCGVLDPVSREMVINQLMALGVDSIDIDHLKWVILMVLSNYSEGEGISELTESLVLDGLHTCIH